MSNRNAVTQVYGPLKLDKPHAGHFIFGVLLPAAVIAIELGSRMCADSFFDPMPTWWHVALVALVPAANLTLFARLGARRPAPTPLAFVLSGASIAIAAFYTAIFLPLLPIALVAVLVGIGILPFAPLASLVTAWRLRRMISQRMHPMSPGNWTGELRTCRLAFWAGVGGGMLLLAGLDLRVAATRLGAEMAQDSSPETRDRGLWLLRNLGDRDQLLRYCYDFSGRPQGLVTAVLMLLDGRRHHWLSPIAAREVYYRVTGEPFNARPVPYAGVRGSRRDDFARDQDVGGSDVAGRVTGLSLASSGIDGSLNGDDAVAYLEWTLAFSNVSLLQREARLQIALPSGGVVSRATLWVNGEEREAAFASRAAARKAYENVVRRAQDPLLVTTKGADRVLVQAFPVPPNGTIKIRLGITAPAEVTASDRARLALPAILDRNFDLGPDHPHAVWLESKQRLLAVTGLDAGETADGRSRLSGNLPDAMLSGVRMEIDVMRDPGQMSKIAKLRDGLTIKQEIQRVETGRPVSLVLLVDGSVGMRGHVSALLNAIAALPHTQKVGLVLASERPSSVPVAPYSTEQAMRIRKVLEAAELAGGADNTDGLISALKAAEPDASARIIWIHAPQPVAFATSQARLEQALTRLTRLAPLTLYGVSAGPNQLLGDAPWSWSARLLPRTGTTDSDLTRYFAGLMPPHDHYEILRSPVTDATGLQPGSDHIARLWARDEILARALADPGGDRGEAIALAATYQLVTPVSGAVVLETARQYAEAGLTPVAGGTVPTVPEPHEWALLIIALLSLTWIARRHVQGTHGA